MPQEILCPRCGAAVPEIPDCPRCGVVLAKARAPRREPPRGSALKAETARDRVAAPRRLAGALLVLIPPLAVALVAGIYIRRDAHPRPSHPLGLAAGDLPSPAPPPTALGAADRMPPPAATLVAVPLPGAPTLGSSIADADLAVAEGLADRLRTNQPLDRNDLGAAEDLYARYPEPGRALLEAVLLRTAQQEHAGRRDAAAVFLLQRALAVSPRSVPAFRLFLTVRIDQGDWSAAEAAARGLLSAVPGDAEATRALAYALVRLDRTREAIEILTAFLREHDDPEALALIGRIQQDAAAEAPLGRQDIAHFHVRYDGAAHEDVGREVLRVLDRHYATLVRTFDHQPAEPIAVILLSRERYYDATGAPFWSGGLYDTFDGRVRVPIGGLTTSLTPDLDRTLLHELAHAFVAGRSGGLAPREIHEGLAQLVSGHQSASPSDERLRGLATGRIAGVEGFYLGSLAFVEELVAQRGQGGINDLLAAMERSRNVDAAFRQVYDKDFSTLRTEFSARLRQRYGS